MITRPTAIRGRWRDGYALDFHTVSSTHIGDDEFGNPKFETVRTAIGELLYRLKYRKDMTAIGQIVDAITSFVGQWNPGMDTLVPVPPSRGRPAHPVAILAALIAPRLGLAYTPDAVRRTRAIPALKDIVDYTERARLLDGVHSIDRSQVQGRRVLVFDDLYRSGATMNAVTAVLFDVGLAADVCALAITRTRSNR